MQKLIPTVESQRLLLRPPMLEDAEDYARVIWQDAEVVRYLSSSGAVPEDPLLRAQFAIAKYRAHWEAHGFGMWLVASVQDGSFMGHAGIQHIPDSDVVEVAYALGRAYWGAGYATEAARTVIQFAFNYTDLDEIVGVAFPDNVGSMRVLEKIGMTSLGVTDRYYGVLLAAYRINRLKPS